MSDGVNRIERDLPVKENTKTMETSSTAVPKSDLMSPLGKERMGVGKNWNKTRPLAKGGRRK